MAYLQEHLANYSGKTQKIIATCKYVSDSCQVIRGLFKDHVIRFSQPWVLNDPIEVNPGLVLTFANDQTNYTHYTYDGVRLPSYRDQVYLNLVEARYNRYGILSLSKNLFNYDMWNRYANAHKGFIVDFRQNIDEAKCFRSSGLFSGLVRYVTKYEIEIDSPIGPAGYATYDHLNRELFLTKTAHWKEEQEYRIVRPLAEHPDYREPMERKSYRDKKTYLFDYDPSSIAAIIFGAAMAGDKKKEIFELTADLDVVYCQCLLDKSDDFAMYYLPVSLWTDRDLFLSLSHQVFVTDGHEFKYRELEQTISSLEQIPYFMEPMMQHVLTDFISSKIERKKKGL